MQLGRLPNELPFTMSIGYDDSVEDPNSGDVERKPMSKYLSEAVSTNATFDALYMVCTFDRLGDCYVISTN